MNARKLKDELDEILIDHGNLNVPISLFINHERYNIAHVDVFTDGQDEHLHSIDLNADSDIENNEDTDLFYILLDEINLSVVKKDGTVLTFDNKDKALEKAIGNPYQIIEIPYSKI